VQLVALGHALDGLDLDALRLGRKHQAGADQPAVDHDAAGAAVTRAAAFLAAGESEIVAQDIKQGLVGVAQELGRRAVDGGVACRSRVRKEVFPFPLTSFR